MRPETKRRSQPSTCQETLQSKRAWHGNRESLIKEFLDALHRGYCSPYSVIPACRESFRSVYYIRQYRNVKKDSGQAGMTSLIPRPERLRDCGVVHFDLEIELYSLARVFIRNSCCLHSRLFLFHILQFFCLILLLLYCEIKVDHQPAMLLDFRVFFHFKVPSVRLQGIIH